MLYNIFLATKDTKCTKDYGEVKGTKENPSDFFLEMRKAEVAYLSFLTSLFATQKSEAQHDIAFLKSMVNEF